jgi:hypothetical protein
MRKCRSTIALKVVGGRIDSERPAEVVRHCGWNALGLCFAFAAAADCPMHQNSLPTCNANASSRMTLCIARTSHFYRAKFIPQLYVNRRTIVFTDSGNDVGSVQNGDWK